MTDPGKKSGGFRGLFWALVVALVVRMLFVQAFRIPSGSMEDDLLVGDFLLVNKCIYSVRIDIPFTDWYLFQIPGFKEPEQGEVVVFKYPHDPSQDYIKRLIAQPGQTLEIKDQVVTVDGTVFPNPPLSKFIGTRQVKGGGLPGFADLGNKDWFGPLRIPKKGDTLVLGRDNPVIMQYVAHFDGHKNSGFERNRFYVDGKETWKYVVEQDYYFVMGDNRDNSADSRFWGFVPRSYFVGRASIIYFSVDGELPWPFGRMNKFLYDEPSWWNLYEKVRWQRIFQLIK